MLTGSKSKGRSKEYYYYHCYLGCKCRFRAEKVNDSFLKNLKKYAPKPEMTELAKMTIEEAWYTDRKTNDKEKKNILTMIKEQEAKLSYSRELLLTKEIEPAHFKEIKSECKDKIARLEVKLSCSGDNDEDISSLLSQGIEALFQLNNLYEEKDIEVKREIIGSIYP